MTKSILLLILNVALLTTPSTVPVHQAGPTKPEVAKAQAKELEGLVLEAIRDRRKPESFKAEVRVEDAALTFGTKTNSDYPETSVQKLYFNEITEISFRSFKKLVEPVTADPDDQPMINLVISITPDPARKSSDSLVLTRDTNRTVTHPLESTTFRTTYAHGRRLEDLLVIFAKRNDMVAKPVDINDKPDRGVYWRTTRFKSAQD